MHPIDLLANNSFDPFIFERGQFEARVQLYPDSLRSSVNAPGLFDKWLPTHIFIFFFFFNVIEKRNEGEEILEVKNKKKDSICKAKSDTRGYLCTGTWSESWRNEICKNGSSTSRGTARRRKGGSEQCSCSGFLLRRAISQRGKPNFPADLSYSARRPFFEATSCRADRVTDVSELSNTSRKALISRRFFIHLFL
jgi:hypothetical protein